ncbi:MAG: O-phospho-L-seryl-tRNA:Cys-tRNA synthase, partial [Tumebacillaceae bacterium]
MDGNAHYTTHVAAERNKLEMIEVPNSEHPEYRITPQKYQETIEDAIDKGIDVKLALLTHVDGNYGNLTDAKEIGKVAHKAGIPIILN